MSWPGVETHPHHPLSNPLNALLPSFSISLFLSLFIALVLSYRESHLSSLSTSSTLLRLLPSTLLWLPLILLAPPRYLDLMGYVTSFFKLSRPQIIAHVYKTFICSDPMHHFYTNQMFTIYECIHIFTCASFQINQK